MSKENIIVGLEIGTTKVCVAVADLRPDGSLKVLGFGQSPSLGVRKGEIVHLESVHKCVRDAVADAEQKSDVSIRSVYVGITGGHISSFNNRGVVELPEGRDEIHEDDLGRGQNQRARSEYSFTKRPSSHRHPTLLR